VDKGNFKQAAGKCPGHSVTAPPFWSLAVCPKSANMSAPDRRSPNIDLCCKPG